ncbi:MAG: LytR/AlgR family response regulator transcription factor [Rufibacter sp.]
MRTYKTLIVDDEPAAREGLAFLLKQDAEMDIVGVCKNGIEAIEQIRELKPDLVFLDVQMPQVNGFEVLQSLEGDLPVVVFVTAYDQYALAAFECHAVDYLLKPFTDARFTTCLQKCKAALQQGEVQALQQKLKALLIEKENTETPSSAPSASVVTSMNKLAIKVSGKIVLADVEDIWFIEAEDYYVNIHYRTERFLVRDSMKHLEQTLPAGQFCRIHKSTLVNLQRIAEVEPYFNGALTLKLTNGQQLKVSKNLKDTFLRRIGYSL